MSGVNTYNLVRGIGLLLAILLAVGVACWFSAFWNDAPDYGMDEEQLMPVLIDHGDGTIAQAYVPVFGSGDDPEDADLEGAGKAFLIIVAVIAVLVGAARG